MVVYCAVFGCFYTSRNDKDRRFFHFPKDEIRCKQWAHAAGRPELLKKTVEILSKNYFVCDLHFQTSDRLVKKLKTNVMPTLNLPHHENVNPTKCTQTEDIIPEKPSTNETASQACTYYMGKRDVSTQTTKKLSAMSTCKRKLNNLQTECKRRKILETQQGTSQKDMDKSKQLQKLIKLQRRINLKSHGNRYDEDLKLFASNLYVASPLAYRVLAKTLSLPSERTLRRIKNNIGTNFSPDVLESLEINLK